MRRSAQPPGTSAEHDQRVAFAGGVQEAALHDAPELVVDQTPVAQLHPPGQMREVGELLRQHDASVAARYPPPAPWETGCASWSRRARTT